MYKPIQNGRVISGGQAFNWLSESFKDNKDFFTICSAFLRSEALTALLMSCNEVFSGRILVRWRIDDLINGASNLEAFNICCEKNIKLFMRTDFHGKAYMFPKIGILIGSANATSSGLGLKPNHNEELCTIIEYDQLNKEKIDNLFLDAIEVTNELFNKISEIISSIPRKKLEPLEWPLDLIKVSNNFNPNDKLLISECFSSSLERDKEKPIKSELLDDLDLIGLKIHELDDKKIVYKKISQLKIYKWLIYQLKNNQHEIYFGTLSSLLHSSLIQDPIVYRKDVKELLNNMLSWITIYCDQEIKIDRPNHSQRVSLLLD